MNLAVKAVQQLFGCWLLLGNLLPLSTSAAVPSYVAEGVVRRDNWDVFERLVNQQEHHFRVSVHGDNWLIELHPIRSESQGLPDSLPPRIVYASDSTNFYELLDTTLLDRHLLVGSNRIRIHGGRIGPGNVPFGLRTDTLLLWYAYASHSYFPSLREALLHPPTPSPNHAVYATDFRVPGTWHLHEDTPHLPKALHFRSSPQSISAPAGVPLRIAPYRGSYAADHFGRAAGMALPLSATWEYRAAYPEGQTNAYTLTGRVVIQATNLQGLAALPSFRPRIVDPVNLTDLRTISPETPQPALIIDATEWPELPASLARARALAANPSPSSLAKPKNPLLPLFVIVLLGGPLAFAVAWKRQVKRNPQ